MEIVLTRGTLWRTLCRRSAEAVARGALHSIETRQAILADEDLPFVVRVVSSLQRKIQARQDSTRSSVENPFLPYEQALFVADVSSQHVALLNKFNVIDHHLLLVTRAFEHQETVLTQADFTALWCCLKEYPALGFYNGGAVAGASQPHKHLQLVPLPLCDMPTGLPFGAVLAQAARRNPSVPVAALPFAHAFCALTDLDVSSAATAGRLLEQRYLSLLDAVHLSPLQRGRERRQGGAYNLLVTTEWMLLVPRAREHFHDISLNALAFVGSLFVRSNEQLQVLEREGPVHALRDVTQVV